MDEAAGAATASAGVCKSERIHGTSNRRNVKQYSAVQTGATWDAGMSQRSCGGWESKLCTARKNKPS